nr:uncharacterized protein LOC110380669 [Helicoverpa armigera]XP_049706177.1 uncharacterized protein LOC110380669 [Helicoverpa armigera]
MKRLHYRLLFFTLYSVQSHAMVLRNDALISKMVSDFQKDNPMAATPRSNDQQLQQQPKDVMSMMQNVLCRNFPTIPCDMIQEDDTLRNLIERSIQQLKYKKLSMEKTTPLPGYHLTLFPTVNSEDLSNFLQVSDTGYYTGKNKPEKSRSRRHRKRLKNNAETQQTGEKESKKKSKTKKDNSRTSLYNGRKKIRKFYPHKIKYKDKQKGRKDFGDYSEEKLSMSVEVPDLMPGPAPASHKRMNYKVDPADPPVWRIDYMKHGEPSINAFPYESERLKEKLIKTGPNVIVSDNMLEQASRKDVLHPDVYIRKNFVRKNALDINSAPID